MHPTPPPFQAGVSRPAQRLYHMQVCRYDEGNTAVLTCPYRGWSFGTDGWRAGVPSYREAYHEQLDRSQ